jgi:proteasome lid subunit RPN8/RPN11
VFRRVHRTGPPVVDVDATIDATADAGRLVVVTSPSLERDLDVAVVVESTAVAAVWSDAIAEFERSLRRVGAFRSISHWSVRSTSGRHSSPALTLSDASGFAHHPDRLHTGRRRLVLLLTDGAADHWYSAGAWDILRSWATLMPTAIVQLLPESYWGATALGRPSAVMRSMRPAAPNPEADVRYAWWDDVPAVRVPVPVLTMSNESLAQWANAITAGTGWIDAIWAAPPDRPLTNPNTSTTVDRLRSFQARSSPQAQMLARILAGAPALSLSLIRVLQSRLVPGSGPAHLAEVLVSGLFERAGSDPDGPRLLLRPGLRDVLRRGATITQEWDTFEVLTDHLERHAGSAAEARALLASPHGAVLADAGLEPFAAMGRDVALRLGIDLGQAPGVSDPEAGPAGPRTPAIGTDQDVSEIVGRSREDAQDQVRRTGRLTITEAAVDAVVDHARRDHPDTACGLVAGFEHDQVARRWIPITNKLHSMTSYEFEEMEWVRVWREMLDRGEVPLVLYHSNTATEAYPSRVDIDNFPGESWGRLLIVSTRDSDSTEIRWFEIAEGVVTEREIQTSPID